MMIRVFSFVVVSCILSAVSVTLVAEENWARFRGPGGMGQTSETKLPTTWNATSGENILWKVPLPATMAKGKPDHNQSSPIVVGQRVIVTTSFWPSGREANEYPEHHVTCFDLTDGKQLWDTVLTPGPWKLSDLRGIGGLRRS